MRAMQRVRLFHWKSKEAEALIRRVLSVARVDLLILTIVIFDMVMKPS